jgi:hypothetical protein
VTAEPLGGDLVPAEVGQGLIAHDAGLTRLFPV